LSCAEILAVVGSKFLCLYPSIRREIRGSLVPEISKVQFSLFLNFPFPRSKRVKNNAKKGNHKGKWCAMSRFLVKLEGEKIYMRC
jgi:hypothetical protein